jgi:glycosyltransferase involved in cell wall biosynthesis
MASGIDVVVLIPCYNEELTVRQTVEAFRATLPDATIYVYDNNSRDQTAQVARDAGAIVRREPLQGKGNVVRRMFADIEADVYVMTDGDATYDATSAPAMIQLLVDDNLDMVVGRRVHKDQAAYRLGHVFGNKLLTWFLARLFGERFGDILSGYRVMSRRFVKSFPALTEGFETETELSVHALNLAMPIAEVETPYFSRPPGSASKLSTFRDGFRVLKMMLVLFKSERPQAFFGIWAALFALTSIVLGVPIVATYLKTGLVPRFPTAILAASIALLSALSLVCGLVLDTVSRGRRELKRLAYLAEPSPQERRRRLVVTASATAAARPPGGPSPQLPG